jgi:hypothetical protein
MVGASVVVAFVANRCRIGSGQRSIVGRQTTLYISSSVVFCFLFTQFHRSSMLYVGNNALKRAKGVKVCEFLFAIVSFLNQLT